MSIASEISRLYGVKADILRAISDKGVEVPSGSKLAACPGLIASISSGGGVDTGKGLYLTSDGKLTTEEPEENFIDITDEWEFDNGFRLQYNDQFPGFGNDMRILYSPVSDTVKFTSECRINATTPLSINQTWSIILRYIGNRFYTTYDTVDPNLAPSIGQSPALGGMSLTVGTDSTGKSNNSFLKLAYVGSPNNPISYSGLAIELAIPDSNSSTYGCILKNLIMKVHKKV